MKQLTAFFFLACFASSCAYGQYYPIPEYTVLGVAPTAEDEAAIDRLMESFRQAWARQDADELTRIYSADVQWTNAFGRTFRGTESLQNFLHNNLFPNYPIAVSQAEMESLAYISRRYLGESAAVLHAYTISNRGSAVSGSEERRVFFDFVLEKDQDGWRIVHHTITDVRPRRD